MLILEADHALYHAGVKGMKWGVRRAEKKRQQRLMDEDVAAEIKGMAKAKIDAAIKEHRALRKIRGKPFTKADEAHLRNVYEKHFHNALNATPEAVARDRRNRAAITVAATIAAIGSISMSLLSIAYSYRA